MYCWHHLTSALFRCVIRQPVAIPTTTWHQTYLVQSYKCSALKSKCIKSNRNPRYHVTTFFLEAFITATPSLFHEQKTAYFVIDAPCLVLGHYGTSSPFALNIKAESRHFGMISASSTHNHKSVIPVYFNVITAIISSWMWCAKPLYNPISVPIKSPGRHFSEIGANLT